jgi:hypothetical protein
LDGGVERYADPRLASAGPEGLRYEKGESKASSQKEKRKVQNAKSKADFPG